MRNALCQPVINRPLRFKRWSRKAYAAFVSIQHHVTIGQLSAHIADRFQAKHQSLHTSVLCSAKPSVSETEPKDEWTEKTTDLLKAIAALWAVMTIKSMTEQTVGCRQTHTINWTDYNS